MNPKEAARPYVAGGDVEYEIREIQACQIPSDVMDGGRDSETAMDKGIIIVLELENFGDPSNAFLSLLDHLLFISFRSIRFENIVKLARGMSNERN